MLNQFNRLKVIIFLIILLVSIFAFARSYHGVAAEDGTVIVLDDKTPSVDVAISTDHGASGVVDIEMQYAALHLINNANAEVLNSTDTRVSLVAIRFAQG